MLKHKVAIFIPSTVNSNKKASPALVRKICDDYESSQEPEQPGSVCFHCGHLRSEHKRSVLLLSTSMVHTPGLLLTCINDYACKSKQVKRRALNIMKSWQNNDGFPSDETLIALLKGEIEYTTVKEHDEKAKMELEHVVFELP